MSPEQLASGLTHLPDLVFIDSSGHLPKDYHAPVSIVASGAIHLIKGDLKSTTDIEAQLSSIPSNAIAVGYIDYQGTVCFGVFDQYLQYFHDEDQWYGDITLLEKYQTQQPSDIKIGTFSSNFNQETFEQRVESVKEYIAAGDIYQVNLSQRFSTTVSANSLFPLYQSLRKQSPAPMSAYLKLEEIELLSASPETFLSMQDNSIETRPIKGTRPRSGIAKDDAIAATELLNSEKENAELTMITDLLRNDIGQVCEYGSVNVPTLNQLEELEHVYHLISTVQGTLRKDCSHLQALAACSPGGSITGAPKIRAMEIIEELETVPRGLYTGSIGYFSPNGNSQFSIIIRTLIRDSNELHYHVGAGIVADSDPTAEYIETLDKAKGIRLAIDSL